MPLRQYDAVIGRFNSIDPVTHHSMSPYMAFDNNPVFWADPSGADAEDGREDRPTYNNGHRSDKYRGIEDTGGKSKKNKGNKNSSSTEQEQNTNRPPKINMGEQSGQEVLDTVIAWAQYIIEKEKDENNKEKIYFLDIVANNFKRSKAVDKAWNIVGYDNQGLPGPVFRDDAGNTMKIGVQRDYFAYKNNEFTEIIDVWPRGRIGKSKRYEIRLHTRRKTGNGTEPTLIGLYFYGNGDFYRRIKNRIYNPVKPTIIDGKEGGKLNIPIIEN